MFRDTRNLPNPSRWPIIHYIDEKSEESDPPPRGGRPPKPKTERLNRRLVVCLNETDYEALCRKAGVAGLVCAEYARRALARSIVRARMTHEMLTLLRQLTGKANNLNQLACMAHVAGYGRDTATLAAFVDRIDALLTRIDKLP